ncbi:MAG TPA: hypothetical protein VMV95_03855, partial [Bacillota bacterium]|nr:hypothetical protein [Bacillota bacterium]
MKSETIKAQKTAEVEKPIKKCCECEEVLEEDNIHYQDDKLYCENCFNDNYFICDECGGIFSNDD